MESRKNHKSENKRKRRRRMRIIRRCIRISIVLIFLLIAYFCVKSASNKIKHEADKSTNTKVESQTKDSESISEDEKQESDVKQELQREEKVQESVESSETQDTIEDFSILFTGDVLFSQYVLDNESASGVDGIISDDLQLELQQADITMINEEFPFSTRGTQAEDKQYTFRVDPKKIEVFKTLGIDIVTLANNHCLDFGTEALTDSFKTLDGAGIKYVGAGDSLERAKQLEIIDIKGTKVGFLAASRVIPEVSWNIENQTPGVFCTYDSTLLVNEIKESKKKCDYTVVYVHWGIERNNTPEEYQRQLAKEYIDAGADIIVGSHPHVLQGIEYYKGKPIIYSLGNFIFGRTIEKTAALKVTVDANKESQLQIIPCSATNAYTVELENQSALDLFDYMEEISYNVTLDETGRVKSN